MKYLKSYSEQSELCNESLRDQMVGPNEADVLKSLKGLNDSDKIKKIIIHGISYDLLPSNLTVKGDFYCTDSNLTELPDNLTVKGRLDCSNNQLTKLPNNLKVKGNLFCYANQLTELPDDLIVGGGVDANYNPLPKDTKKPKGVKGKFLYNFK